MDFLYIKLVSNYNLNPLSKSCVATLNVNQIIWEKTTTEMRHAVRIGNYNIIDVLQNQPLCKINFFTFGNICK